MEDYCFARNISIGYENHLNGVYSQTNGFLKSLLYPPSHTKLEPAISHNKENVAVQNLEFIPHSTNRKQNVYSHLFKKVQAVLQPGHGKGNHFEAQLSQLSYSMFFLVFIVATYIKMRLLSMNCNIM